MWTPWRDDEGADEEAASSAANTPITAITCVTESPASNGSLGHKLVMHLEKESSGGGKVAFEGPPEKVAAWAAALQRLVAIVRQRRSYETLYGGANATNDAFSPRTIAVSSPKVREPIPAPLTAGICKLEPSTPLYRRRKARASR